MGSSDERNSKAIDAAVGGLVWVRRRNGSWWPGRIMGLDEVPESSLVSPKAGTPIKLLGRDDASVDWYNLEKSKRVKAFRCGEYDACIEKAKAAAASSSKKAVKYARREDAIIHALEIENAHLAKDSLNFTVKKENSCIEKTSSSGEVPKSFLSGKDNENTAEVGDAQDVLDSAPELMQSVVSSQETNHSRALKEQPASEKRRRTPNDSEDDGTEGIKRMRGLEDLGMGIGSKGKGQASGLIENIKQENGSLSDVNPGNSVPNVTLMNGNRVCSSSLKRKRSQVLNANEYSKRKNRRRPLMKLLESTAMVSIPVTCGQLPSSDCSPRTGFSDSKVSGMESHESMRSLSAVINNNSDSTGISCENAVSLNASENVCDAPHNKAKDSETSSISVLVENDASDRLFDVPLIGEEKHSAGFSIFTSCSPGRTLVSGLTKQSGQSSHVEVVKAEGTNGSVCMSPAAVHVNDNINGIEKSTSKWQLKGKRNSRQMSRKQEVRKGVDTDEANNFMPQCSVSAQKTQPRFSVNMRCGTQDLIGRDSTLYEVKIEVRANYKPRDVPLVSLMSKLNGKAIIGHPLTVEVLEEGSCDRMVSSLAGVNVNSFDVPMVSAYELAQAAKPRSSSKKKSTKKKSHVPPRKSSKANKSSSLSKKTRRLSSLTSQKPGERGKKQAIEKPKEHLVSCIPLKVVFSRINEAVKGSTRQAHRALASAANT